MGHVNNLLIINLQFEDYKMLMYNHIKIEPKKDCQLNDWKHKILTLSDLISHKRGFL